MRYEIHYGAVLVITAMYRIPIDVLPRQPYKKMEGQHDISIAAKKGFDIHETE